MKKNSDPVNKVRIKKSKSDEQIKSDNDLRELLLFKVAEYSEKKFSDEEIDNYNLRRELLKHKKANPELAFLIGEPRAYLKKFPIEFYKLIYILNFWKTDGKKLKYRPRVVAKWTNEIIYQRFPNGILKSLQDKNPMDLNGKRTHKHFQFLSLIGEDDLLTYINDAMVVMRKCTYWYEFRIRYAQEYGLQHQKDLFVN